MSDNENLLNTQPLTNTGNNTTPSSSNNSHPLLLNLNESNENNQVNQGPNSFSPEKNDTNINNTTFYPTTINTTPTSILPNSNSFNSLKNYNNRTSSPVTSFTSGNKTSRQVNNLLQQIEEEEEPINLEYSINNNNQTNMMDPNQLNHNTTPLLETSNHQEESEDEEALLKQHRREHRNQKTKFLGMDIKRKERSYYTGLSLIIILGVILSILGIIFMVLLNVYSPVPQSIRDGTNKVMNEKQWREIVLVALGAICGTMLASGTVMIITPIICSCYITAPSEYDGENGTNVKPKQTIF
ncbi:hypothetical protein ABK040_005044 [Willaertia magna]